MLNMSLQHVHNTFESRAQSQAMEVGGMPLRSFDKLMFRAKPFEPGQFESNKRPSRNTTECYTDALHQSKSLLTLTKPSDGDSIQVWESRPKFMRVPLQQNSEICHNLASDEYSSQALTKTATAQKPLWIHDMHEKKGLTGLRNSVQVGSKASFMTSYLPDLNLARD